MEQGLLPSAISIQYLIGVGSSLGNREQIIRLGIDLVANRCGPIEAESSLRETHPVGPAIHLFLNGAFICRSKLLPIIMLQTLHKIEAELGRVRRTRWEDRTLDLDILLARFDNDEKSVVQTSPELTIPHPELLNRSFALLPAIEIAPDWIHPSHPEKPLSAHCPSP